MTRYLTSERVAPLLLVALVAVASPTLAADGDQNAQAAKQVFRLPEAQGSQRADVDLTGLWEVARHDDPDMDKDTYVPVQALPPVTALEWMGIRVPGSLRSKPETDLAHRVIYRTRIDVPASHAGRGFKLHFKGTSWIVSVFVNGRLAGSHRGVWIPWDLDISGLVRPGQVNELAVAVKSPWYGFDTQIADVNGKKGPGSLKGFKDRKSLGRPIIVPYGGKGDGNGNQYGIVNPVTFTSVGEVYTEDVFAKTSVRDRKLTAELTLRNTTDRVRRLQVHWEAVNDASGEVEKRSEPRDVTIGAGKTLRLDLASDWASPRLWWPKPNPNLYRLRTIIRDGGRTLDAHEQLFGFREVTIDGTSFRLNGVRWNLWGWWGVQRGIGHEDQYADELRRERTRFNRFFSHCALTRFRGAQEDRLEYYDRHGIAGAESTMIEGMGVAYILGYVEKDAAGKWRVKTNEPVWDEFRRHMRQITRAYRNHPSVLMYSLENETIYINAQNFYGWISWSGISKDDYMNVLEEAMTSVARAGQEWDDTRPYVVSGAGDLNGRLPMNTPHYPRGSAEWYPENAYTLAKFNDHVGRWAWKRDKPWYVPESTFADDLNLATYTLGDEAYRGQDDAQRGKAVFQRMLFGGYRWTGATGWSCCGNYSQYPEVQAMLADLCVIPRRQTSRLYAGRANRLLFKVMNDTFSDDPVTFTWRYDVAGQRVAGDSVQLNIEPGFGQEQTLEITPPQADKRLEGTLTLEVSQDGAETYIDVREVPVLPVVTSMNLTVPVSVYDRTGRVEKFLSDAGVKVAHRLESLDQLQGNEGLVVVGPDTLTEADAYGQALLAAATRGMRVVVLDQTNPPAGENLPISVSPTNRSGGYAHPQGLGTPVFRDLGRWDLIDWASGEPVYRNVYRKPPTGARSLAHCGSQLPYSALMEVPCGKGFIVLSQLAIGSNLGVDPAADVLLRNLVEHYASVHQADGVAVIYAPDNGTLAEKVRATGLRSASVEDLASALNPRKAKVAVIDATPANVAALNERKAQAQAFQEAGGWIMLCGLSPDGMDAFNAFTDGRHILRPFRLEQVTFEGVGHPLAATLGNQDVSLVSNDQIQHGRRWPSANTFSYVIDGLNFAPFCRVPDGPEDPFEYKPLRSDKDPFNLVNGLRNSLSWRCIRQIWWPGDETPDKPLLLTFQLRRPDVVQQINVWNNANYSTIRDLDVIFDGDESTLVSVELPDSNGLREIRLEEPRQVRKTITLRARTKRLHGRNANLVGIDNVQFLRPSAPAGRVYLDNVGGLVAIPRGEGGVLLNQVKFMSDEPSAANASRKQNLLGVLLRNLGVGSAASVAVPGVNIRYQTVDLIDYANQYRDTRWVKQDAWFGKPGQDLTALEVGEDGQAELAGVSYRLVRFRTAPKQDCIMLGAPGAPKAFGKAVRGIRVGRTCDMLFFLHAADVTQPVTGDERGRIGARRNAFKLPTVMKYVLKYADGETAEIPVILERNVQHWLQEKPRPLSNAQVAWSHPVAGGKRGVVYSMKAANPRPGVAIETIDVEMGDAPRATPAVLAITLGDVAGR
jgi:glycosyl hydrolase family 2